MRFVKGEGQGRACLGGGEKLGLLFSDWGGYIGASNGLIEKSEG